MNTFKDKIELNENGYWQFKDSGKFVHRWKMEKHLGRKLKPNEVVHHINHNKTDNRIENLEPFPDNETHLRLRHPEMYHEIYEHSDLYSDYSPRITAVAIIIIFLIFFLIIFI